MNKTVRVEIPLKICKLKENKTTLYILWVEYYLDGFGSPVY
jgi:hypothetical protein